MTPTPRILGRDGVSRDLELQDDDCQGVELAVEFLAVLTDVRRMRIVLALCDGDELSAAELTDALDIEPAQVSQHLARLRLLGAVATRTRDGQTVFRLTGDDIRQITTCAIHHAERLAATCSQNTSSYW